MKLFETFSVHAPLLLGLSPNFLKQRRVQGGDYSCEVLETAGYHIHSRCFQSRDKVESEVISRLAQKQRSADWPKNLRFNVSGRSSRGWRIQHSFNSKTKLNTTSAGLSQARRFSSSIWPTAMSCLWMYIREQKIPVNYFRSYCP